MHDSASRFPSALRRHHGASEPPPRREGPSPKELAMMTSDQLRDYYKRKGEWQEPDYERIQEARRNDYASTGRKS